MTLVPFTEWTPDTAEFNGDNTGDILNVLCSQKSYIPFPDLVPFTSALPAQPLGYFRARSQNGQVSIFAGTATKLYQLNNTTLVWTDVSKAATTYGANTVAQWCFEQFGDYVIAVNINDNPQVFQLGVSTQFADLGGSPPKAAFVRAWGDFLCLLQLATNPNRVQWSGLNNIAFWTPGSNNSDFQDFPEGGVVQGSSRATNPIIFLERNIYRATFVPGSSVVFTFQKIQDKRGAKSPYSIASRGDMAFYADEGGFFQVGADGTIAGVGFEKVDRTIFGQMSASNIASMVGAIDPFYSRVYWACDLTGKGTFGSIVIYDWQQQRWSIASQDNVGIFPAATAGYTLEGLDSVSTNIDLLPYSLDAKVWQGGAPLLAAFTTDFRLGFFNGTAKQATITTQEQGDVTGTVTLLTSAYPIVDTNSYTVAIGTRMKRGDAVTWTANYSPNSRTGRVDIKVAGRFLQAKTIIPAGTTWGDAQGIELTAQSAGMH
ncbi:MULTISPECIES: hypothetical protein [unclassified Mesorhizobium]|uniref:hypothetical protein n=1 Tax=unclassified Mesorhizobium TaxID=325217 RepID=UPI000FC9AB9A|nr:MULTISPECIES: hypothetical protein [unclassified Mesorhizobium]TGP26101.1 hypothetical protein EN875_034215 [Mesorhizobium sp. M2D.F.Ca.ET.232.01.1.1]TGQ24099.1 hypothetical protein EN863_063700 [Mesorhizobium sp. M00.F.Ca.ET.220.01.1.1]TGT95955.1 hypothetical protein EN806_53435 [bacterium M00.F.Ca.ET.163.01.1.1]